MEPEAEKPGTARVATAASHPPGRVLLRRPGAVPPGRALTRSLKARAKRQRRRSLWTQESGGHSEETAASASPQRLHREETHSYQISHQPPGSHTCGAALRRPRPGAEPASPTVPGGRSAHRRRGSVLPQAKSSEVF